jgi:hypothetical protein
MNTTRQSPNIAILFGLIAILTSIVLVFNLPSWLNYVLAIFWLITGLLGFYVSFKK